MRRVIYEAKPFYGVNPAFVVFCIITALITLLLVIYWNEVDRGVHWFISFIIAFLLFIIFCQVYTSIDAKNKVYDEYEAGNYLVVEGTINDYILAEDGQPRLPDRFNVNDIEFSIPGFVSFWGYPLKSVDGGMLKNGMSVRIYYITYKFENVIMKLEQLD